MISFFKSPVTNKIPSRHISFKEYIEGIKKGEWKSIVTTVRLGKRKKASLPYVTLSGKFKERSRKGFLDHSGYIGIDIDKQDNNGNLKKKIKNVFKSNLFIAYHRSVSGKGYVLVAKVDPGDHRRAFEEIYTYLHNKEINVDKACKDVTRARFVSYDPELQYNEGCTTIWPKTSAVRNENKPTKGKHKGLRSLSDRGLKHSSQILEEIQSAATIIMQRPDILDIVNSYDDWLTRILIPLARTARIYPELENDLYSLMDQISAESEEHYDEKENRNKWLGIEEEGDISIGSFLELAKTPPEDNLEPAEFDQSIFEDMPEIIRDIVNLFDRDSDRDLAMVSSLTLFSQLFVNTGIGYNNKWTRPNLFTYIVAGSGEGKSAAGVVKNLFSKVDYDLAGPMRESIELFNRYKEADKKEKDTIRAENDGVAPNPIVRGLFISPDITAAYLAYVLNDMNGTGVLFATEGDIVSRFKGGEHNISAILRVGHSGEEYYKGTKGDFNENKRVDKIDKVTMSVLITSTPGQLTNFIDNLEDGLFTRFLYMPMRSNYDFVDLIGEPKIKLEEELENRILNIYDRSGFNQGPERRVYAKFFISQESRDFFVTTMSDLKKEYLDNISISMNGVVNRIGEMILRISVVIEALNIIESGDDLIGRFEIPHSVLKTSTKIGLYFLDNAANIMKMFGHDGGMKEQGTVVKKKTNKILDSKVTLIQQAIDEGCSSVLAIANRVTELRGDKGGMSRRTITKIIKEHDITLKTD